MKNSLILIFALIIVGGILLFVDSDIKLKMSLAHPPAFEEFYVGDGGKIVPANPDFSSRPEALMFKTRITEGAKLGPNFAGRYTVVTWGCGTSCQMSAILDSKSGKIIEYGLLSTFELDYRLDSRLLKVNPKENFPSSENTGILLSDTDYYLIENDILRLIGKYDASGKEVVCESNPTTARHPALDKFNEFESECRVPFGWVVNN